MAPTGPRGCQRSFPGGEATTSFPCFTGSQSMGRTQRAFGPTITTPWPSFTRRTSSPCASAGRPGGACRSDSRATGRRPPRSAASDSLTCSRAKGGAGRRSPRHGGRRRPRTSTDATWSPPKSGPGCTRPPSVPPLSTSRASHTQPVHRARLALLADRRTWAGLVLLRRRCARRPQPVVAGDAGAHQVP